MIDLPRIVQGDVHDTLRTLPSDSFKAGIADVPYGTKLKGVDWDQAADFGPWIEEAYRVLAPGGTIFVFGRPEIVAEHWHRFPKPKDLLAWHYPNKVLPKLDWFQPSWDAVVAFSKGKPRFFRDQVRIEYSERYKKLLNKVRPAIPSRFGNEESIFADRGGTLPKDMFLAPPDVIIESALIGRRGADQRTGHPTTKPLTLMEHLILAVTQPGEPILDLYAGSGSTSVAAQGLGRPWLAIERNPVYVEMIRKRIASLGQPGGATTPDAEVRP